MPQTVLVVDDSDDLLLLTQIQLERAGYRVVVANNGRDALDLFVKSKCDAVVLDYDMPDLTGAMLAQEMYSLNRYAHIIMFSGLDTIPPEALRYVDGLVRKGESGTELVRQLKKMFGEKEAKSYFEPEPLPDKLDDDKLDDIEAQRTQGNPVPKPTLNAD